MCPKNVTQAIALSEQSGCGNHREPESLDFIQFKNCISLGADYCEQLLSASRITGSLEKYGPMSYEEAFSFFSRYRCSMFPLYIANTDAGYFAFY